MTEKQGTATGLSRRKLMLGGLAVAAVGSTALPLRPARAAFNVEAKALAFNSLHTGETAKVTYWEQGAGYLPDALGELTHILRDWRTEETYEMDLALYDLLFELRYRLGSDKPFQIISGYRSPKTNAQLASNSNGVAKRSYHMKGMAIDIALPDVELKYLRQVALDMQMGGVGYYPSSGFVHVDTGPVRRW
jgi:uncharacterized protein YcbK (DUF882 family)